MTRASLGGLRSGALALAATVIAFAGFVAPAAAQTPAPAPTAAVVPPREPRVRVRANVQVIESSDKVDDVISRIREQRQAGPAATPRPGENVANHGATATPPGTQVRPTTAPGAHPELHDRPPLPRERIAPDRHRPDDRPAPALRPAIRLRRGAGR